MFQLSRASHRRSSARSLAHLGAAALVVALLAACGTTDVGFPTPTDPTHPTDPTVPTDPPSIGTGASFVVEAETTGGSVSFAIGTDAAASRGGYLVQPATVPASTSGHEVTSVAIDVEEAGDYTLWARVYAPALTGDAVYLGFDGTTRRVFAPTLGSYVWIEVERRALEVGTHRISLGHGEPGLRVDLFAVVSDEVVSSEDLEAAVAPPLDVTPPDADGTYDLRGTVDFDPAALTPEQRLWYERLRHAMATSESDAISVARSDNSYNYGRGLYQRTHALLLALRVTGDLAFLDAVDVALQNVRNQLDDGWCDGVATSVYVNAKYGTVTEPDGYLNFRFRHVAGRDYCRDTGELDEILTHGHLAYAMYAFHVNRDLKSPAGVDYGERADFWFDYLRNHFEAKWRARSEVAWPAMNFIELKFCHTHHVFLMYHHFMGARLQSEGSPDAAPYVREAARLTGLMFDEPFVPGNQTGGFVPVNAPTGDAVIYTFGSPGRTGVPETSLEACPMTYARYMLAAVTTLRLENLDRWDDAIMTKLANGLSGLAIDVDDVDRSADTIAAGVSGSTPIAGMGPTTYRSRLTIGKYAVSSFAALSAWDASGVIESFSMSAYDVVESSSDAPKAVQIPSNLLFLASVRSDHGEVLAQR